jgi:hypothetical protein
VSALKELQDWIKETLAQIEEMGADDEVEPEDA